MRLMLCWLSRRGLHRLGDRPDAAGVVEGGEVARLDAARNSSRSVA
jgi:hypothetical protein